MNSMEWICTECGDAAKANAVQLLVQVGWWITEPRRGICPSCVRRVVDASGAAAVRRARNSRDAVRETLRLAIEALSDDPYGADTTTRQ